MAIYIGMLYSVLKVSSEPTQSNASNAIVMYFAKQNLKFNVKSLWQVEENSNSMIDFFQLNEEQPYK